LRTRLAKQLLIVHQKHKMTITPLLFYFWYSPISSLTVTSSFLSRAADALDKAPLRPVVPGQGLPPTAPGQAPLPAPTWPVAPGQPCTPACSASGVLGCPAPPKPDARPRQTRGHRRGVLLRSRKATGQRRRVLHWSRRASSRRCHRRTKARR
jgi:hypothetical protein